jgi:hypothetical protein
MLKVKQGVDSGVTVGHINHTAYCNVGPIGRLARGPGVRQRAEEPFVVKGFFAFEESNVASSPAPVAQPMGKHG